MQMIKKDTITSLELLEQINFFRKQEGKSDMQHKTLLEIIRGEFEEEISQQELLLSNYYSRGKEFPMFILTLNQSKQVLSRESKFVRKAVIQYIENLEQQLQKPLSVEEMIIKQAESMIQVKNDIQRLESKFDTVVTLESGKQRKIQIEIASRVYKLLPEPQSDLDNKTVKEITRSMFSNIHRDIKRKFGVASYKDIKVVEYEKALEFINFWIEDVI